MIRALIVVAVALMLTAFLVMSQHVDGPLVVSGFVEADEIRLGSRVGGRVLKVHVSEGENVSAQDVLVELEPFDLREKKAQAEQILAQAQAVHDKLTTGFRPQEIAQAKSRTDQLRAALEKLQNGPRPQEIAAAESGLRLAESELSLARIKYQRTEALFGRQAADKADLDEASTGLSVAQARVDARTEELAVLQEGSRKEDIAQAFAQLEEAVQELNLRQAGYRTEEIREAKAGLDAAQAALQAINRQLEELSIKAPADAVVESIELQPGDLVTPNAPAVSLMDVGRLWVRAYVPENHLNLENGQKVEVRVDSFPEMTFAGVIRFVARQAEFTPGNVQTPEERSQQVFRIKVEITAGMEHLRPGMAADVVLESKVVAK